MSQNQGGQADDSLWSCLMVTQTRITVSIRGPLTLLRPESLCGPSALAGGKSLSWSPELMLLPLSVHGKTHQTRPGAILSCASRKLWLPMQHGLWRFRLPGFRVRLWLRGLRFVPGLRWRGWRVTIPGSYRGTGVVVIIDSLVGALPGKDCLRVLSEGPARLVRPAPQVLWRPVRAPESYHHPTWRSTRESSPLDRG